MFLRVKEMTYGGVGCRSSGALCIVYSRLTRAVWGYHENAHTPVHSVCSSICNRCIQCAALKNGIWNNVCTILHLGAEWEHNIQKHYRENAAPRASIYSRPGEVAELWRLLPQCRAASPPGTSGRQHFRQQVAHRTYAPTFTGILTSRTGRCLRGKVVWKLPWWSGLQAEIDTVAAGWRGGSMGAPHASDTLPTANRHRPLQTAAISTTGAHSQWWLRTSQQRLWVKIFWGVVVKRLQPKMVTETWANQKTVAMSLFDSDVKDNAVVKCSCSNRQDCIYEYRGLAAVSF